MELDFNVEELVDLSFLTDEELDVIVQVLYRDMELRLLEDQRIKKLQQSVLDPEQLKIATGDWFKEVREKRHTDKNFGSDIVRASIRKKKRTKGERQKKVTISDKKIIINEQGDQEVEQQENVDCAITNGVSPEQRDTGMVEADCEESEVHNRLVDNEVDVTSKEETLTLPANTETQTDDNMAPERKVYAPCTMDDEALRTEESNISVSTITVQSSDGIDGDSWSQHSDECRVPTKDVDVNSSLSSFQSAATQINDNMAPETKVYAPCTMDDEALRTEKSNISVSTITVQSGDGIDGDSWSQHSDECRVPTKDVDVNSSLSSFQSAALSGSIMSLYSNADVGCVDVRGSITFSLHFDENSLEFKIHVVQCDDLAAVKKNRSDPYVKSYLLPDKSSQSKRKTSVKKKTLNPTFNEWLKIAAPPNMIRSKGQLSLSLKFIPAGTYDQGLPPTAELHIWLKEARNLIPFRSKGINSFVKCYILPDVTKSSRQKTRVIKKDLNPVYNHTMVYDGFQTDDMSETCAQITVWDHDTFSNQFLGGLRLSLGTGLSYGQPVNWMDSNEEEISAWQRMLSGPGQWMDSILPLRPDMDSME
ncbi:synaptotagmin-like protein 1 isoform X2 [Carcharodon carcharias]|uniref:synaptotagmin-like protein 1 isoform X2 n=1 Tax=Carcharodon carcharias TaxID=13397 RepID=UPI001B7E5F74|nr:synaptotagmin-like protein 1 isoform X2 [Carcharodon carcharias]